MHIGKTCFDTRYAGWIEFAYRCIDLVDEGNCGMTDSEELKRTLARLTSRNVEIARLLERLQSGRSTDDTKARDAALRQEFDANEALITRLTGELRQAQ